MPGMAANGKPGIICRPGGSMKAPAGSAMPPGPATLPSVWKRAACWGRPAPAGTAAAAGAAAAPAACCAARSAAGMGTAAIGAAGGCSWAAGAGAAAGACCCVLGLRPEAAEGDTGRDIIQLRCTAAGPQHQRKREQQPPGSATRGPACRTALGAAAALLGLLPLALLPKVGIVGVVGRLFLKVLDAVLLRLVRCAAGQEGLISFWARQPRSALWGTHHKSGNKSVVQLVRSHGALQTSCPKGGHQSEGVPGRAGALQRSLNAGGESAGPPGLICRGEVVLRGYLVKLLHLGEEGNPVCFPDFTASLLCSPGVVSAVVEG